MCLILIAPTVACYGQSSATRPADATPPVPERTDPAGRADAGVDAGDPSSRPATRPVPEESRLELSYTADYAFETDVPGQDAQMRGFAQDLSWSLPLGRDERNEWRLLGRFEALDFDTDAWIPGRFDAVPQVGARGFPDQLWNVEVGTSYRRQFENDWQAGGTLMIGSPSDRPFASGDEISVRLNAFLRVPAGERDSWWFYLSFANARDFAEYVPLPGVGYEFRPDDRLSGMAGFPFSRVRWQPVDWLRVSGDYIFPHQVDAEVALLLEQWELYSGYAWENRAWFLHDRREDDDRLFHYEQSVRLGLRSPTFLDGAARVEVEGGFRFQRYWFEGEDYGDRHDGRIDLADGPYARVQLRIAL